jgi:hypothetical protein
MSTNYKDSPVLDGMFYSQTVGLLLCVLVVKRVMISICLQDWLTANGVSIDDQRLHCTCILYLSEYIGPCCFLSVVPTVLKGTPEGWETVKPCPRVSIVT